MNILLVEDEAGILQFLQQGLEEEQFNVTACSDGREGLRYAQSGGFDLILLDWMLPGMTGLEICTKLREKDSKTPVIFLTAKDTTRETIAGLQAGANDYIKKPFSFDELLERIKVQLRGLRQAEPELRLGSIVLNTQTHQVFNAGQEVVLTNKEFSLLRYLIENKGTVCTRSQIIEEVWNIKFDYDTGVIDVFMNSLRKKLNLRKEEDCIKTIRGVGYIATDTV